MSIANLKDQGNKGNNFPWQYRMLKLLSVIAAIGPLGCCPTAATEETLGKFKSDFNAAFNSITRIPGFARITGGLTIAPGLRSMSVYNSGGSNGVFQGEVIKPGERFSYDAGGQTDLLGQFDFDATGTEFVITSTL